MLHKPGFWERNGRSFAKSTLAGSAVGLLALGVFSVLTGRGDDTDVPREEGPQTGVVYEDVDPGLGMVDPESYKDVTTEAEAIMEKAKECIDTVASEGGEKQQIEERMQAECLDPARKAVEELEARTQKTDTP